MKATIFFCLTAERGSLGRIVQKLNQLSLAPHKGQLENKYYKIVQALSLEGKYQRKIVLCLAMSK